VSSVPHPSLGSFSQLCSPWQEHWSNVACVVTSVWLSISSPPDTSADLASCGEGQGDQEAKLGWGVPTSLLGLTWVRGRLLTGVLGLDVVSLLEPCPGALSHWQEACGWSLE
jgi:hypothetical protein